MELRIFAHSWISDWNHGNAHFMRGLARALVERGHGVRLYEAAGGWSVENLFRHEPLEALAAVHEFRSAYPMLDVRYYVPATNSSNGDGNGNGASHEIPPGLLVQLEPEVRGAEVVIVHEWNEPVLLRALARLRRRHGFKLIFHDTHHRSYSEPQSIARFPLDEVDAVLAFGEAIRRIYERQFGVKRSYTFHEAADTDHFRPRPAAPEHDVVWIGNWGDEERTRELHEFLLGPAAALKPKRFLVHGVRYPEQARRTLVEHGVQFSGYLPNLRAPRVYASSSIALHIPRGPYRNGLGGIPTIRVFEALACGVPLVCSPWEDSEHLFEPGRDFVVARDGAEMTQTLKSLLHSPAELERLRRQGRETVMNRHTCRHRAVQLEVICRELG